MNIRFNRVYKSIKKLDETINYPDFVLLTGYNGSGKTQLLEGINCSAFSLVENENILSTQYINLINND